METAEAGKGACLGTEMLKGSADFGCDGLFLDEEEVGFDELRLFRLLVFGEERGVDFIGVGRFDLVSCSGGSLDHGKGSNDITVGVGDLVIAVSLAGF